jgi:hypothetical protein
LGRRLNRWLPERMPIFFFAKRFNLFLMTVMGYVLRIASMSPRSSQTQSNQ